jgi:hypothetical protein
MNLYSRDYTQLLPHEKQQLLKYEKQQQEIFNFPDIELTEEKKFWIKKRVNFFDLDPACRYHLTLFPNHYLDPFYLSWNAVIEPKICGFLELLNCKNTTERDIHNFISKNEAYYIIGSLLSRYDFGHHYAFLFPEFNIGSKYKADYLLIGAGSDGYFFVFVELESIYGNITINNGDLGECFRKGISQIKDWKYKIEGNFSLFRNELDKYKSKKNTLPDEFVNYDSTRFHYIVICGRRVDFSEKTYRERRTNEIVLLHYDNLYEHAKGVIGNRTY